MPRSGSRLLVAACLLLASPLAGAQDDAESALLVAQQLRRQGRMAAAGEALDGMGAALTEHQRGRVLLVRGNIAFERLDYAAADGFYRDSEAAFERARLTDDASGAAGAEAARDNQAMVEVEQQRREGLAQRAATLRGVVLALMVAAVTALGLLARRSTRSSP